MSYSFVTREPAQFANLSNSRIPLFDLEHPIIISSIIVCNRSNIPIRVNLELKGPNVTTYLCPNARVGINGAINLCIPIPDPDRPEIMQEKSEMSLPIDYTIYVYSAAPVQKFDCTIFYSQLNEIPEYENAL